MKSNYFFAVDSFPLAILKISGGQALIQEKSTSNLQVIADLTIRGITETISFPISLKKSGTFFIAEGTLDIDLEQIPNPQEELN